MKKAALPKAIAAGARRQERRAAGAPPPAATPGRIIRALVPIRPVLPAPAGSPSAVAAAKAWPSRAPGRLTAVRAVQAQRDKGRARAIEAGPTTARRALGREIGAAKKARLAQTTELVRKNPTSPMADLNQGRLRYSGAFSSSAFRAPFQSSYNARRSFGA